MPDETTDRSDHKPLPTPAQVAALLDPYDACKLECDGMTNVAAHVLWVHNFAFQGQTGIVQRVATEQQFAPHHWLVVPTTEGDVRVDYRARMWLAQGEAAPADVPHGVFPLDAPGVRYFLIGRLRLRHVPMPPVLFTALTGLPAPTSPETPASPESAAHAHPAADQ